VSLRAVSVAGRAAGEARVGAGARPATRDHWQGLCHLAEPGGQDAAYS